MSARDSPATNKGLPDISTKKGASLHGKLLSCITS
jgi:hypothetical protein